MDKRIDSHKFNSRAFHRTPAMNQKIDINSIDFAALSLNQTCSQPNGMFRGWGSEETRKAYASLEKLADSQNHAHLVNSQALSRSGIPTNNNSSMAEEDDGFFISEDDMDCDGNFW
jgi:hypothetical protein